MCVGCLDLVFFLEILILLMILVILNVILKFVLFFVIDGLSVMLK